MKHMVSRMVGMKRAHLEIAEAGAALMRQHAARIPDGTTHKPAGICSPSRGGLLCEGQQDQSHRDIHQLLIGGSDSAVKSTPPGDLVQKASMHFNTGALG